MPNQEQAPAWIFGNSSVRVGTLRALSSLLENFRPPFLLTRLTAPGSPRMGVLNQQILIHRCLLYEESMECGPPCHISGCKKVQFYYLRLVYYQESSRHF